MITSYGVRGAIGRAINVDTPMLSGLGLLGLDITGELAEGESEDLDFLGAIPALAEWGERRQSSRPIDYSWSLKNKKFESSINLPKKWIRLDKTGLVRLRINALQRRYFQWKPSLIADLINDGASTACFTGDNFFDDSHTWGDSTCDNNITQTIASASAPTADEMAQAVMAAWEQMQTFTDDRGEPINEMLSRLVVVTPPAHAAETLEGVRSKQLDTGSGSRDNPLKGLEAEGMSISVVTTSKITLSNKIAVINASPGAAPFIVSETRKLREITSKAEGSDYEHDHDAWEMGIKTVGNGAYGLPTDAVLVTLST